MKALAIIPARSGSKGVKDKNIKLLCEKPLLAYTIEAAIASNCFSEIMVSTDSHLYESIALMYGAKVPFLRSEETASDVASSWDVVKEVLESYKKLGKEFSHVCLLQPTSPLRDEMDIQKAFQLYAMKEAKAVVSVCEESHSRAFVNCLDDSLSMNQFIQQTNNTRRQDLQKEYRINGAIYLTSVDFLYENTFLYREGCYAYVMNQMHSVDIDSELDFTIAKAILEEKKCGHID